MTLKVNDTHLFQIDIDGDEFVFFTRSQRWALPPRARSIDGIRYRMT
jgi:hypothetical protein